MTLHVTLVGSCLGDSKPPTRAALLSSLRRCSPRAYHATRSFLWTEDSLFSALSPLPAPGPQRYAFAAPLSCGGNTDDARVALMLLLDLTAAVPGLAAAAVDAEEAGDDADALLVEIADAVESTAEALAARLARWGVGPRHYHRALVGRAVLADGALHVVPASGAPARRTNAGGPLALLAMSPARRRACREVDLTAALREWADGIARVMREESWHLAVAAVPERVARLLDAHPGIERAALLHHCVRCPESRAGSASPAGAIASEFRAIAQSRRCVRIPLRLPRYLFAHLFFTGWTGDRAAAAVSGGDADEAEELRMGLQLTIALHRLRREVHGPHAEAVEKFLRGSTRHEDVEVLASDFLTGDAERGLERLRRKVMPCTALRGASTEWMAAYAGEAAMAHEVTGEELTALDEAMLDPSSGSSSSDVSDEEQEDEDCEGSTEDDESHTDVVDAFLAAHAHEELLNDNDAGTALDQVAENVLFRETVKMLSGDSSV